MSEIQKWGLQRSHIEGHSGLFSTTQQFFDCLDTITETQAQWEKVTIVDPEGKKAPVVYYMRDPLAVLQEILSNSDVKDKCVWAPVKLYGEGGERVFTDMHTADWWWEKQVMCQFYCDHLQ